MFLGLGPEQATRKKDCTARTSTDPQHMTLLEKVFLHQAMALEAASGCGHRSARAPGSRPGPVPCRAPRKYATNDSLRAATGIRPKLMQTWVGPTSTAPLVRQEFKEESSEGSLCRNRQNADPAQNPQAFSCCSNRTNVLACGAHLPPTSTRQRHAWTSSGRGRRPCTWLPVTAA